MSIRALRPDDRGFAILEVGVALCLLSLVAVGICGVLPIAVRAVRSGGEQSMAMWLAVQRLEDLCALPWTRDDMGLPVSDTTTDLSVEPFVSGGTGLQASPADALDANRPGFVDYLDGTGRWVGTGAVPPPTAVYIRRWSVVPAASAPADAVLLQVLVTSVRREAGLSASTLRLPHLVDALVATMRTRVVS